MRTPGDVTFDREIVVPFAPETAASAINDTSLYRACWYSRDVDTPELGSEDRIILHFGAVDYAATVWIGETVAVSHEGGYLPTSPIWSGGARRSG